MARRKSNTETGRIGEQMAHRYLEEHGYAIVEHNWRCQEGELDIVARQDQDWVFIEVKARRGDGFGTPEDAITPAKQKKLLRCGLLYIAEHMLDDANWRIDVVAVYLTGADDLKHIRVYENAVQASGTI